MNQFQLQGLLFLVHIIKQEHRKQTSKIIHMACSNPYMIIRIWVHQQIIFSISLLDILATLDYPAHRIFKTLIKLIFITKWLRSSSVTTQLVPLGNLMRMGIWLAGQKWKKLSSSILQGFSTKMKWKKDHFQWNLGSADPWLLRPLDL